MIVHVLASKEPLCKFTATMLLSNIMCCALCNADTCRGHRIPLSVVTTWWLSSVLFPELSSGCRLLDIAAPVICVVSEACEAGLASATMVCWPSSVFAQQQDTTDNNVKELLEIKEPLTQMIEAWAKVDYGSMRRMSQLWSAVFYRTDERMTRAQGKSVICATSSWHCYNCNVDIHDILCSTIDIQMFIR
jgi:hypothetical protein